MVPLVLFFIWAVMLSQARFTDRLIFNQLRLRPVRSISIAPKKRWYILTIETRFSVKSAPSEVTLSLCSTDWIGTEVWETVTLSGRIYNGGVFCFLVQLQPGLQTKFLELDADVTTGGDFAFYPSKVEIRRINRDIFDLPKIFKLEKYSSVKHDFHFDGAITASKNSLKTSYPGSQPSSSPFHDLLLDHFPYENFWTTPSLLKRYSHFSQTMRRLVGGISVGIVVFVNFLYYLNVRPGFVFISSRVIIFGPFYLSPHLFLSSLIAVLFSTTITTMLKSILEKVPPASLSCLSRSAVILRTFYIRKLISIFLVLVISWLAIHCAVGYQNLSVFDRDLLATSVFVSVVADVIFIPLLKSYALAVAKRAVNYPIIVIFPKLTAEYLTNPCSSTIFKSTTTALEMKKTMKRSKQRRDILKTLFKFLKLGLISGSLLGITNSIVPTGQSKFFIDSNIRQALEAGLEDVLSMKDIWTYLSKETISFIHPKHLSPNGEKLSEDNRKFAADLVNFRLGPAILKQHRNTCGIYEIQSQSALRSSVSFWPRKSSTASNCSR